MNSHLSALPLFQLSASSHRNEPVTFSLSWLMPILLLLPLLTGPVFSQAETADDKTLSPFFFVPGGDPKLDQLPLKSTQVEGHIAGVIADLTLIQTYKNEGQKPLEAVYIFPASTRAAVYAMKMTIGERTVTARIKKREEARQDYENAKKAGQTASLLEQQRPNVFQMNVANILPGDVIRVEMRYTELLVPTDGVYELVYPTVVGPRYSNQPAAGAPAPEKWVANPYLRQGETSPSTFDLRLELSAGLPLGELATPSHKTDIQYEGPASATVRLDPAEKNGGNRDFILRYRLSGGAIESGLLLGQGDKENFYLLMVQPPKRITQEMIPPREYIFIVDVSGSMHGFPLEISKKLLSDLIGGLRPLDHFNVLLFSGGSTVLAERSLPASQDNIAKAVQFIDRQRGGGGTELLPALRRAMALPRPEGISRTMVIATDGYVSVEKESFDFVRQNLNSANLFAFGIGTSVNRHLIEGLAHVGMGEPFIVTHPDGATAEAARLREYIRTPVLTSVKISAEGFETYAVEPPQVPDVLAERPVIVFGKWRGAAAGRIVVEGLAAGKPYRKAFEVSKTRPSPANGALRQLWARHRIALLSDYNLLAPSDERVQVITDLGLAYSLLTDYTSFVAVDSQVRNQGGENSTVQQPLPLPAGVPDQAVGGGPVPAGSTMKLEASRMYAPASNAPAVGSPTGPPKEHRVRNESARENADKPDAQLSCFRERVARARFPAAAATSSVKATLRLASGKLSLLNLHVSGTLSKTQVQPILEKLVGSLKSCFEVKLKANPHHTGDVTFKVSIRPDGSVSGVEIVACSL